MCSTVYTNQQLNMQGLARNKMWALTINKTCFVMNYVTRTLHFCAYTCVHRHDMGVGTGFDSGPSYYNQTLRLVASQVKMKI